MNSWHGIGRLVRDPDFKTTASGMEIAKFTVAIDRRTKKDDEKQADFIPCTAFGKTATFVSKYFFKGSKIVILGRIQTGSYDNKDGAKVYTTDIMVDEVEFGDSKKSETNGANQYEPARTDAYQPIPNAGGFPDPVSTDDDTSLPFDL